MSAIANIKNKAVETAANYHFSHDSDESKYTVNIIKNIIARYNTKDSIFDSRREIIFNFLREVCHNISPAINASFVIELHDGSCKNDPVFCFSNNMKPYTLIPDLYAMMNYSNKLSNIDTISFEHKINKALFIGSSTGSLSAESNERLKICNKYRNNSTIHCYISAICQLTHEHVRDIYPNYNEFLHNPMSLEEQYKYRYIISIDGNTSAWDRVPWILNSNSVLLMKKSEHKCWYYDFLIPNVHYIPFDDDTDLEAIVLSNEDRSKIIKNANQFVKDYLAYDKHKLYMQYLLQAMSSK